MKYFAPLLIAFLFATQSSAQKVTFNGDTAFVDGVAQFLFMKEDCIWGNCNYRIRSFDGTDLIFITSNSYIDKSTISETNKEGTTVWFFEWTFLASEKQIETAHINEKKLVKLIYNNGLIKDSKIDAEQERKFVLVNGKKYSEKRDGQKQPQVIIIKE